MADAREARRAKILEEDGMKQLGDGSENKLKVELDPMANDPSDDIVARMNNDEIVASLLQKEAKNSIKNDSKEQESEEVIEEVFTAGARKRMEEEKQEQEREREGLHKSYRKFRFDLTHGKVLVVLVRAMLLVWYGYSMVGESNNVLLNFVVSHVALLIFVNFIVSPSPVRGTESPATYYLLVSMEIFLRIKDVIIALVQDCSLLICVVVLVAGMQGQTATHAYKTHIEL
ncbi:hypothetical protein GUITHDRAFT_118452 [Guillardia theta CCMP2712]|uniref:Uncharacterized protein n=1 Tax=Guillardia theta (strain CCMP2712) TaxID=905079 RepID=L1IGF1_GUITC|nr:hypothetical protein GUITHDRAFT_118452 [Guillardia theta CCMP2712]EKX35326.1 hypothetical protein GUITHDRAFT_118452 [Guillardia theta CCMP2712]|eukprot:XP_005822306.1 hypothetical protein GUITHDRAFT_118452 [Guillardia theta CCMP2712]